MHKMDDQGYKILVSTSGRFAAGTDARVFIKLIGTNGDSDEIELKDNTTGKQLFEAGSTDEFNVKIGQNIGFISKINLRHDDSGRFSGWHPNKVEIIEDERGTKYRFDCKRWLAKDEGDGRISVELENKVLPIVKIDQLEEKNRPSHNTVKFTTNKFVVRRGQSIFMDIHLARAFSQQTDNFFITLKTGKNPREFDKSFVHIQKVDEFDAFHQIWAYKVIAIDNNVIHIEVNCPCDSLIAKYDICIEDDNETIYRHKYPLMILFNPWNKADDVYMEDNECLKEYVLRQHGIVFTGSSKHQYPMTWYFGQFEEISLDCAFKLLDQTKPLGKDSPIEITRRLSSLVNSLDNKGLLVGNWSGKYEGGKAPTHWTSSPPIFESYMDTDKSVKYGQCWVFSALLTTILRCLGIPCRPVTNFNSAHDTDGNISKDIYVDDELNRIEGLSSDTIWNFHCWNDAWMARPDLKPGYGGWQAVDATPQETSHGLYQCGPCSLRAIKEGDIDLPYDGTFILAEVNSDIITHKKVENGEWDIVGINRSHVGKKISTKAVGKSMRNDITHEYKFAEKSTLERASVRKAMGKAGNIAVTSTPKTLQMKVKPADNVVEIGKDIDVIVYLKNTASKDLSLLISIGCSIIRYNGVVKGELDLKKIKEKISGNEEKEVRLTIKGEKYMNHLDEYTTVRLFTACTAKETNQVCTSVKLVDIRRPDLKFVNIPNQMKFGEEQKIEIEVYNPLDVALTGCSLHLDGTLMKERILLECSDLAPKTSGKMEVVLSPNTRTGSKSLLATFNSHQLVGINSSMKFKVVQHFQ